MDEEEAVEQEEAEEEAAEEAEPEPDTEADPDPDSDAAVAPVASPSAEDGDDGMRQAGTQEQRAAAEGPVLRILPLGSGLVLIGSGLALALAGLRLRRG
ncbi:hypothetical protein [Streptomyces antibioticus]|uniref:hypothetical protein n=1 Tax=Streptomyces antibioticus TaxID=1890 RepID=UPI0036DD72DA